MVAEVVVPEQCMLCPRACGADRAAGKRGVCGADDTVYVARAALHEWEEPPLATGRGSGAVFFSHCPLRCVYCQNASITHGGFGLPTSAERLSQILLDLQAQDASNINLVTATHYLPWVAPAIEDARKQGLSLPVVWNTSGYESLATIHALRGLVDVYLTDFKYDSPAHSDAAQRYSHAPDYFYVALSALDAMLDQVGEPRYADDGALVRGVVVRHLLLPGRLEDAKRILSCLFERYGTRVLYSVMNQYTPIAAFPFAPELNERTAPSDYEELLDFLDGLGMDEYFWQDGEPAHESFIPAFDATGVVP